MKINTVAFFKLEKLYWISARDVIKTRLIWKFNISIKKFPFRKTRTFRIPKFRRKLHSRIRNAHNDCRTRTISTIHFGYQWKSLTMVHRAPAHAFNGSHCTLPRCNSTTATSIHPTRESVLFSFWNFSVGK